MGCKVCRVLSKYDCEYHNDRLVEQWTAPKSERKGYRQLARWLNVNLLRRQMDRAGLSTLGGEAESRYDRLTEESSTALELRDHLESEGIKIDKLTSDFVSYGVIRRHLHECLEAERETSSSEWEQEAIEISRKRAEEKIEEAIGSLLNKGRIEAGSSTALHLEIEIECNECNTRIPVYRALRRGYICSCGGSK